MQKMILYFILIAAFMQSCSAMHSSDLNENETLATLRQMVKEKYNDPTVSLNIRNEERGQTPLHEATLGGNLALVHVMLELGADTTIVDDTGQTPHKLATLKGYSEIAHLLAKHIELQKLRKIGAKNRDRLNTPKNGQTPLHIAAATGQGQFAQILLENGANKFLLDKDGNSAEALAESNGHKEIATLIRNFNNS